MTRNWFLRYATLALLTLSLVVGSAIALPQFAPVAAQVGPVRIPRVPIDNSLAQQIYSQIPDLPLENQYISRETGDRAEDDTLVKRLIVYHLLVKGRPPFYRLDWKLTLADYLGANELMFQDKYPSADKLKTNPLDGDRAAIAALSRQQREDLVMAMVHLFNPDYDTLEGATPPPADPSPVPQIPAEPEPTPTSLPSLPQPGDADLLRF